jgi:hypothetical protein
MAMSNIANVLLNRSKAEGAGWIHFARHSLSSKFSLF